jgi:hypothetical protein
MDMRWVWTTIWQVAPGELQWTPASLRYIPNGSVRDMQRENISDKTTGLRSRCSRLEMEI